MIAATPEPPYTAAIFTSQQTDVPDALTGYGALADAMSALAAQQPGWLGEESAHTPGGLGITVSYWTDAAAARAWRAVAEHRAAQRLGIERFYAAYRVRVATVERD